LIFTLSQAPQNCHSHDDEGAGSNRFDREGKSFDRACPVAQDNAMKRQALVMALAAVIFHAFPVLAASPKPCVFIYGGLRAPVETGIGNAFESAFGFSVALSKSTRAVISLSTASHPIIEGKAQGKVFYKSWSVSPFLVGLHQELVGGSRFSVYAVVLGGVLFSGLRDQNIVTVPETTVRQTVPASLALRGAAGVELLVSASFHIFGEAGFLYGKANGTTSYYDFSKLAMEREFRLDLSAADVYLGLRYYF
jgi:hypothetical protein